MRYDESNEMYKLCFVALYGSSCINNRSAVTPLYFLPHCGSISKYIGYHLQLDFVAYVASLYSYKTVSVGLSDALINEKYVQF